MITKKKECKEIIYEKCLIATMLYNEDITKDHYRYIIDHVPAYMLFNRESNKLYQIIINTYDSVDEGLLGTDLYRDTVEKLYDLETDYKSIFAVEDLEEYWYSKSTYKHWVREIQNAYFTEAFRLADTEEEYKRLTKERDRLLSETDMTPASEDITIMSDYERVKDTAVITPWKSVNNLIGSLQGGDMVTLAGSTGCGKTCFMLNLAVGMAKQGRTVDIFSLEMTKNQLVQRIACSQTGVDAKKFRNFSLTDEDKMKLGHYLANDLKKLKINIYPKQKVTISEIERIEKKSKSDIVFIDYLSLVEGDKRLSRYDRFSEISRTMKLMAMTTNKPVIALHQLNREFMQREDKEPKLSDLRESGQIEQDSDMVWFVYRPGLFDGKTNTSVMKFISAKNRHGEPGNTEMIMNGSTQRIMEKMGVNNAKIHFISKTNDKEKSFTDDNNKDGKEVVAAV